IEGITATTAGGDDTLWLANAPTAEVLSTTLNGGGGSDTALIDDLSAATEVNLDGGDDTLNFDTIVNHNITVNGGVGEDTFNVVRFGDGTTNTIEFNGGLDNDAFNIPGHLIVPGKTIDVNGNDPTGNPALGDAMNFDPGDPLVSPSHVTSGTYGTNGTIGVPTMGTVVYDSIENVSTDAAPKVSFSADTYTIAEGDSVTLTIYITPNGGGSLDGPVALKMSGTSGYVDGSADYVSSSGGVMTYTKTFTWLELKSFGISDGPMTRNIGVMAINDILLDGYAGCVIQVTDVAPEIVITEAAAPVAGQYYEIGFKTTDDGADSPAEWLISWGDGTDDDDPGSDATKAGHTYAAPGNYTITVSVIDEDSAPSYAKTVTHDVTVTADEADFSIILPASIAEGDSLDLAVTAVATPTSIAWDLTGNLSYTDATGATPGTLSWAALQGFGIDDNGSYPISVEITYAAISQTIIVNATLIVTNVAPTATFGNDGPVDEGSAADAVSVFFTSPDDLSDADDLAGFTYSYDFGGDGSFEHEGVVADSVDVPASYLTDNGTLDVIGIIIDADGGQRQYETEIVIDNVAPTIDLTGGTPASPNEGDTFSLPIATSDPGTDTISEYRIDWGDGDVLLTTDLAGPFTHEFTSDGVQTITVTARDEDGTYTTSTTVTTANVAPDLQSLSVASPIVEGSEIVLSGIIVDPGTLDAFTLDVTWGDGLSDTYNFDAGTDFFGVTHTYADDGVYPIIANLSDGVLADDDSETTTIAVTNAAPTVVLSVDKEVSEQDSVTLTGDIFDVAPADTHTVLIDWGDSTTSPATVIDGSFTATHPYPDDDPTGTDRDDYVITVTVTDVDDPGSQGI
ncbi:MAG: hypothetical protein GY708_14280, partial [Actinomycetia bacterium]|nr:hypothetical protein [Actinomycetes bacterium]